MTMHLPSPGLVHGSTYGSSLTLILWNADNMPKRSLQSAFQQWTSWYWHDIDSTNVPVWCIGRVNAFRPKGHEFDSRSSHHVGTLGKSLAHNCLWFFGVKFRRSIRAVSGEPLSSSGLEEAL